MSDASNKYCRLKGARRGKQFYAAANRNIGYAIEHLGNRPLDAYSTADAASFTDWLIERQLTSTSTQRIFSTIRAVFNLSIYEDSLKFPNAFANTYLASEETPKRASISPKEIIRV